jgi:hypothetical protein
MLNNLHGWGNVVKYITKYLLSLFLLSWTVCLYESSYNHGYFRSLPSENMFLPLLVLTGHKTIRLRLYIPFAISNGRHSADFPKHTLLLCFLHHPSDVPCTTVSITLRELSQRWLSSSFYTPHCSLISCTVYQNSSLTILFSITCNLYFLAYCRFLFIIKLLLQLMECS